MTVPMIAWSLIHQSSIDRAGGPGALRALARRLVDRAFELEEIEADGWIGVGVRSPRTQIGPAFFQMVTVAPIARSASVRDDQRDIVAGDRLALETLLRSEVLRLEIERAEIPESELRILDGNR